MKKTLLATVSAIALTSLSVYGAASSNTESSSSSSSKNTFQMKALKFLGLSDEAFETLTNSENYTNDPVLQCKLGQECANTENYKEAVEWYMLSASQKNPDGQYNLGIMYETGKGIDKDLSKARYQYGFAAYQGHEEALKKLINLAKETNDLDIQNHLGEVCCGIGRIDEAIKWFTLSAEQGNPDAQFSLGLIYNEHPDYYAPAKAMHFFKLAADQGHMDASQELSEMDLNDSSEPQPLP